MKRSLARLYRAAAVVELLELRRLLANVPIVVNTADDDLTVDAFTSLREAINVAENQAGDDTITFDPAVFTSGSLHAITLSNGQLQYSLGGKLTIAGPGTNVLKISGEGVSSVFEFGDFADVSLSGMMIADGFALAAGAGIHNTGILSLNDVIVTDNKIQAIPALPGQPGIDAEGGGIFNSGTLAITDSTISFNQVIGGAGGNSAAGNGSGGRARGGGIYTLGDVTIVNSSITNNALTGGVGGSAAGAAGGQGGSAEGGAIFVANDNAVVSISQNCGFAENTAAGGAGGGGDATHNGGDGGLAEGGAIQSFSDNFSLSDSDFDENTAFGGPGGPSAGANPGAGGFGGGGGVSNLSVMTITDCDFQTHSAAGGTSDSFGGQAAGGAILNQGVLHLGGGTFTQNLVSGGTGGINGGEGHGGVLNTDGIADLLHVHFEDNTAEGGNAGASGNNGGAGEGGGIWSDGELTVTASNITGNTAAAGKSGSKVDIGNLGAGGGIFADDGSVTLDSATLNGNQAIGGTGADSTLNGSQGGTGYGGGIFNVASLVIKNSTLYFNHAFGGQGRAGSGGDGTGGDANGGAIYQTIGGSLQTINATINANVAAGGVNALGHAPGIGSGGGITNTNPNTLELINTIVDSDVADMGKGPDLFQNPGGGLFALDHSLISTDAETGYNIDLPNSSGYITGQPAKLDTLQDNGGPTKTVMPLFNSPAINAGNTEAAIDAGLTFDQRGTGFPRIVRQVDIGAVEFPLPIMTVLGNLTIIADNDTTPSSLDFTDFGTSKLGTPIDRSFTIRNDGTADLNLGLIDLPVGFSLLNTLPATIAPQSAVGINIRFNPGNAGAFGGTVRIASNDQFEGNEYDFVVAGTALSAAGNAFRVNFQPASAEVPSGYLADVGQVFGGRGNGYSYGWNASASSFTRDRNAVADQAFDTLVHTQLFGSRTWEISVPNGTYSVHLVAGDPSFFDSVYKVNVEGMLTVNGTPTSGSRFKEGTKTVTVTDGKLTITNASGAVNNKLDFIEVTPTPPPPPATIKINFQTTSSATPAGFLADSGSVFGNRGNGQSYGWNLSSTTFTRDRNVLSDQARDTLIHTQLYGTRVWELAVPNGSYSVHVVAGDPSFFDSVYKSNVEGVLTVNGTPTSGSRFVEGTHTVVVSDGKLTVANASGSVNNKINFIEVTPL